jgi:hypothetical protein
MNRPADDLARGWTLPFDSVPASLSESVRRGFRAQVGSRPTLSLSLSRARVTAKPPDWVGQRSADAWLLVGSGIAIPLVLGCRRTAGHLRHHPGTGEEHSTPSPQGCREAATIVRHANDRLIGTDDEPGKD